MNEKPAPKSKRLVLTKERLRVLTGIRAAATYHESLVRPTITWTQAADEETR